MATRIRLARGGSKKRPFYRVVAADVRAPRDGRFIEKLGTYNPLLPKDSEDRVKLNKERIQHWLDHGAVPTDRVARFLDAEGMMKREARNNPNKAKPGKKAEERVAEKAQKEEDAKQAKADAEEAAKAESEAPAEEAPVEEAAAEEATAEEAAAAEETPAADEAKTEVEADAEVASAEEPATNEEKPAE